ncbi:esterase/lipase family protein [Catenulispora yoronensis]
MLGVVFVHGVRSSARMWDAFASVMAGDAELSGTVCEPVPRFEYATGVWRSSWKPSRVIPSISTAADSLREYLDTEAGNFESLVLVGHSQGGLVIQRCLVQMLAAGRGLELARIKRVVLLATPNTGSDLLMPARRRLVRGNSQEAELRPFNELVGDTFRVVARDIVAAASVPTQRSCRIPFSVYAAEQDGVVTRASAHAGFPDAAALPGDHFSVARPDSPQHRTYTTVRRLLMEAAVSKGPDASVAPSTVSISTLTPANLEIHNASDPEAETLGQVPELTAYLVRAHDRQLRTVLSQIMAGGQSRLVILTGDSSTGKTRALYEALIEIAPHAPLLRPVGARDLSAVVESGQVQPGSVLWLNEAQRFLYGPEGSEAAGSLRALLSATSGIAAVATLWSSPYWAELTAPTTTHDAYGQVRALLTHPASAVRINVPTHLASDDLDAWRTLAFTEGDARLRHALTAGSSDGHVIQHLSGGPELVAAYLDGNQGGPHSRSVSMPWSPQPLTRVVWAIMDRYQQRCWPRPRTVVCRHGTVRPIRIGPNAICRP